MAPEQSPLSDAGQSSSEDIQHALNQAQHTHAAEDATGALPAGEVLSEAGHCPLLSLRFALTKCGLIAEKYPWQTTLAFLLTAGAGCLCVYFGAVMLMGLMLTALCLEE